MSEKEQRDSEVVISIFHTTDFKLELLAKNCQKSEKKVIAGLPKCVPGFPNREPVFLSGVLGFHNWFPGFPHGVPGFPKDGQLFYLAR